VAAADPSSARQSRKPAAASGMRKEVGMKRVAHPRR
jgi:hypothetical protein